MPKTLWGRTVERRTVELNRLGPVAQLAASDSSCGSSVGAVARARAREGEGYHDVHYSDHADPADRTALADTFSLTGSEYAEIGALAPDILSHRPARGRSCWGTGTRPPHPACTVHGCGQSALPQDSPELDPHPYAKATPKHEIG
jgi:hypothetical protein